MKVSIITVVFNNKATIADAVESVLGQTYHDIEYIVVDGGSTDGTVEVLKSYGSRISKFVSERDKGLYDAMNKGILMATGDIVGILNSDDLYRHAEVIKTVVDTFNKSNVDSVFGDMIYVQRDNPEKIVRYYRSNNFKLEDFRKGMMPGHASFFVKKAFFEKFGIYNTNYKISADFDLLLRFLYVNRISYEYIPQVLIVMRMGGVSTRGLSSMLLMNKENLQICKLNNVKTNLLKIYSKYLYKIFQFVTKPPQS